MTKEFDNVNTAVKLNQANIDDLRKRYDEAVAYDVPVKCGEVTVNPGDIIFADFDGVVVIPQAIETKLFEAVK